MIPPAKLSLLLYVLVFYVSLFQAPITLYESQMLDKIANLVMASASIAIAFLLARLLWRGRVGTLLGKWTYYGFISCVFLRSVYWVLVTLYGDNIYEQWFKLVIASLAFVLGVYIYFRSNFLMSTAGDPEVTLALNRLNEALIRAREARRKLAPMKAA